MIRRFCYSFFGLLLLQSCSVLQEQSLTEPEPVESQPTPPPSIAAPAEPITYGSFSTETLYSLMVAEIAASRKHYDVTLKHYIEEAEATKDLGIIQRAALLAQYFRKHKDALAMGGLWLAQEPDSIEANAVVATAYVELLQPLKALDHAEVILRSLDPEDKNADRSAAITETIANVSHSTNSLTRQALIERYHTLSERYPMYPAIFVGLSVLYDQQKETAKAYSVVEQALATRPDYLSGVIQQVRLLQASERVDEAIEKLKGYLAENPEHYRLRLLYARLLTQTDIEAAYEEFAKLSEESPQHLDIKFSRALLALELQKRDESQRLLIELMEAGYRLNTVNFYLGNLAEANNDKDQALQHYLSVEGGEDYIAAHSRAARIMAKSGEIAQAQAHFDQLRVNSPDRKPALYVAEAEILERVEERSLALQVLDQGVNEFPDNIDLRYSRSSLYEKTDQLALMENDLRHVLSLEPEHASALNALGYFLTTRTDRHPEALELIRKALALRPDDPAIIDSMGWVLFNLGRTAEAIEYLRKAFELFPDPEVAAHLGEALWVNGEKQEARSIWNNNLKDNPNDSRILDTMERLKVTKP